MPVIVKIYLLKTKIQILFLHNAPKMCYLHVFSNFGLSISALQVVGNRVVLKKLGGSCDSLGNGQETKWIIMKDLQDEWKEDWFYLKESKSGQYLKAIDKQTLTTDGIYLIFQAL